jgi:hypothetical protein
VNARQPGAQDGEQFLQELRSLGAHLTEMEVIRYPLTFTLGEELESFVSRVYSNTWNIPDAIFDASLEELRAWVEREYGDLDGQLADEVRFAMDVARFEG